MVPGIYSHICYLLYNYYKEVMMLFLLNFINFADIYLFKNQLDIVVKLCNGIQFIYHLLDLLYYIYIYIYIYIV